jgi:3-oxoacyl-[acyl-carrier protein] reductase
VSGPAGRPAASRPAATRALVTGASRGIGAAIAEALAADGLAVIINYKSSHEAASALKAKIEAGGGVASLCQFDVADAAETAAAIEGLLAAGDPIGVVVNNAGVVRDAPFPVMERGAWQAVIDTTLGGFFNVTQPLIMPMVRRRWGRIINVSSISGVVGNRGQVNYAAAKAGLIGATKALSHELARRNITVNAVAPGLIDTEMIRDVPLEHVMPLIPARRVGAASEVASLVAFLASDRSAYITGQVIGINGGMA